MNDSLSDAILEPALHAQVARRCERAYVHELRNSMQGVYASVDVLMRKLGGKMATPVANEKIEEMVRKAIRGHEQALTDAVHRLVIRDETPAAIEIRATLKELCAFLGNDAAAHAVRFSNATEECRLLARPARLRLVLLSLLTRGIDSLPQGGELALSTRMTDTAVYIEFALSGARNDALWRMEAPNTASPEDWMLAATRKLIALDGGSLRTRAESSGMRVLDLCYPTGAHLDEASGAPSVAVD